MSVPPGHETAASLAAGVRAGTLGAREVVAAALDRIAERNPTLNAFIDVLAERALSRADSLQAARDAGRPLGALAGVPFAVKNLFDVAGLPTRAGSLINRARAPANADALLVERLEGAGAILVGALNMGEYAYDFTGENSHDGASRNPHDPMRMTGGSSGGSAAAVAGGLVPFALGSDTNGSIRVPSALCGCFGLKPTFGRLPRSGTFPFVSSLDTLGPLARSAEDLALAYDAMGGADASDPACAARAFEAVTPLLAAGRRELRIAVAGGYFREGAQSSILAALDAVARHLGADTVEIPEAARARSAAFVVTAVEGAALHRERLRIQADAFDPDVRDRLLAGGMVPGAFVVHAQKFRRWFRDAMLRLFERHDVIIAPATPCTAPRLGQKTMPMGPDEVPVRPNLGLFTQPFSFIGLPVVTIPLIPGTVADWLPHGLQLVAAPWREDLALRLAYALEAEGIAAAAVPPPAR